MLSLPFYANVGFMKTSSPISRRRQTALRLRPVVALALAAVLGGCAMNPPEKYAASDLETDVSLTLTKSAAASRARGDLVAAATLYRHAHAAGPENIAPLIGLGQVLLASGAPRDAAEALRKALVIDPNDATALRGLGNAMVAIDQPELAIGHFDRALVLTPKEPRLFNGLGVANDLLGRHEEAQKLYRSGLSYTANNAALLTNLGLSLTFSGDFDAGIDVLRELAIAPQATPHHRQNLALALGLAGRGQDAAKIARADLDDRSVRANLAFYANLRALPDSIQRVRAIHVRKH